MYKKVLVLSWTHEKKIVKVMLYQAFTSCLEMCEHTARIDIYFCNGSL
jgi:hypothetical protein